MSAVDLYVKKLFDKYKFLATWLPNDPISIGDYGIISGNQFHKEGNLQHLGIQSMKIKSEYPIDFSLHYKTKITFFTDANATVGFSDLVDIGRGKAHFEFEKEGSFTFDALECSTIKMDNKGQVGEQIKALYRKDKDKWDKSWHVIDKVVTAQSATILVSNSASSNLELHVKAELPALNLADTGLNLRFGSEEGEIVRVLTSKRITPLYTASKLRNSFFGALLRSESDIRFGGNTNTTQSDNSPDIDYSFWEDYSPI